MTTILKTVPLTTEQRQKLRERAHILKPVIMIGAKGLTDAVQKEIGVALETHELIKIKVIDHDYCFVFELALTLNISMICKYYFER